MREYLRAIYDMCEGGSLAYIVLGGVTLFFLLLIVLNFYVFSSDRLAFLLRWLRFCLESVYIFLFLKIGIGLGGKLSLFTLSVVLSIWVELGFIWIRACWYSRRNILPFSTFVECDNAWRPNRKYYRLKQEIEASGFERLSSYRATNSVALATLFYNNRDKVALLVLFRLGRAKLITKYFFISKSDEDKYLVFSNDMSEDILFLKAKYSMHYRTLASFKGLFRVHKRRMKYSFDSYLDFEQESKNLPHLLYNDNLQSGLALNIYSKRRNEGQLLTAEGKFQFCKNLIIKSYFRI